METLVLDLHPETGEEFHAPFVKSTYKPAWHGWQPVTR